MKYIRVKWKHTNPDEAIWLFSELDEDGREKRRMECFQNGFCDFASPDESTGTTKLSTQPLPELTKIAQDPEFEPVEITQEEFETVWKERRYSSQ